MRNLVMVGAVALACAAGSASAGIGMHIGSGLSFGFCGSGFSISSGFSIGSYGYHSGHGRGYYRPSIGWYDAGFCGWDRPRYRSTYRNWDSGCRVYRAPRAYRRARGDCWSDAELSAPLPGGVLATHDRQPNRAPEIKDEVDVDTRTADAWELLERGEANRAQGFFALAAVKAPDDAVLKLGYALACADMGDDVRAAWSAGRAVNVDEGELAALELGDQASVLLADLLDELEASDSELASALEGAMPEVVTIQALAAAE